MGFGNFLGNLAKGYIEERGTKGTVEDLGDLVGGIANFFSSNEKEDEDFTWDDLVTLVDEKTDAGEYSEALEIITDYYNKFENGEADVCYHLIRAQVLIEAVESSLGDDEFEDIVNILMEDICAGSKYNDKDAEESFKSISSRMDEAIISHVNIRDYWVLKEKIGELCSEKKFRDAEKAVEEYREEYDDQLYSDRLLGEILLSECESMLYEGQPISDALHSGIKEILAKIATQSDSNKVCAELTERYNALKTRSNAIEVNSSHSGVAKNADSLQKRESSDSENEYLNEYKTCLEDDGEISPKERRLLDRLRDSLGISEERAAQLEASCKGDGFNENEQEYIDEFKACLADDGEITSKERRLLERLAKSLGITPERAKEIESSIK